MNIISSMAFVILVVTIVTLLVGAGTYFAYKLREKRKPQIQKLTLKELREVFNRKYVFFKEIEIHAPARSGETQER